MDGCCHGDNLESYQSTGTCPVHSTVHFILESYFNCLAICCCLQTCMSLLCLCLHSEPGLYCLCLCCVCVSVDNALELLSSDLSGAGFALKEQGTGTPFNLKIKPRSAKHSIYRFKACKVALKYSYVYTSLSLIIFHYNIL